MSFLSILYLTADENHAGLVSEQLVNRSLAAQVRWVQRRAEYLAALEAQAPDVILSAGYGVDWSGVEAFELICDRTPPIPFIFVDAEVNSTEVSDCLRRGAIDYVAIDQLWRLAPMIQRAVAQLRSHRKQEQRIQGMERLVAVVQELSLARDEATITKIVRHAARDLTGADGATFILRDGDQCHYVDEDAISPLWKGRRFPMTHCIGGWSMRHRQPVIIENVYGDERIPIEAYQPTFIKSLVVVPIRTDNPIGAIGTYWANYYLATEAEIQLLQALANTTSVALENVQIYQELEHRVQERTAQLETANQELESFSYTISHDLRAPLAVTTVLIGLLQTKYAVQLGDEGAVYLKRLKASVQRMDQLIDEILELYQVTQTELNGQMLDLSELAREVMAGLRTTDPERQVRFQVDDGLIVYADPGLIRVALENLLSNAWKYTSKRSQAEIHLGALPASDGIQTFYIRDNGAGFDPSQVDRLFVPFQRLHSGSEFPGTGVGLASVQRIIQKHGGRIWAEAELGAGATFYLSLPTVAQS